MNASLRLLALLTVAMPAAGFAQSAYPPSAVSDADQLAEQVRRLGANPLDLDALLTAGELSLRLDDLSAAGAFFSRAEKIDPRNARAKAGEGALLVRGERPGEALRLFAQAEAMGQPVARFAADRGLAYDLLGDQPRAQRDYKLAMSTQPSAEARRRYALSLGIAGKQAQALDQLAPLIQQNDRAAWRSRAFILAMGGNAVEASRIAQTMMPPGSAAGLQGFFAELPHLPAVDRAFAVHFGEVHPTAARLADARLAPALPPLPPEAAPVQVAAVAQPADGKHGRGKKDKHNPVVLAAAPQVVYTPTPAAAAQAPAYQAPASAPPYQPAYPPRGDTRLASALRARAPAYDRPLSAAEQASLAAAGVGGRPAPFPSGRYAVPSSSPSAAVAGSRPLTAAEQASLAAATLRPRERPRGRDRGGSELALASTPAVPGFGPTAQTAFPPQPSSQAARLPQPSQSQAQPEPRSPAPVLATQAPAQFATPAAAGNSILGNRAPPALVPAAALPGTSAVLAAPAPVVSAAAASPLPLTSAPLALAAPVPVAVNGTVPPTLGAMPTAATSLPSTPPAPAALPSSRLPSLGAPPVVAETAGLTAAPASGGLAVPSSYVPATPPSALTVVGSGRVAEPGAATAGLVPMGDVIPAGTSAPVAVASPPLTTLSPGIGTVPALGSSAVESAAVATKSLALGAPAPVAAPASTPTASPPPTPGFATLAPEPRSAAPAATAAAPSPKPASGAEHTAAAPPARPAAALATHAARPARLGRGQADTILAKIVANLTVPAAELGIEGPASSVAKPQTAAERRRAARDRKPSDDADAAAEKKLAKSGAADRKSAKRGAGSELAADAESASAKKVHGKKAAADKEEPEAKTSREPERIWVQVAGGAAEGALSKAWAAAQKKAPDALAGKQGWTTPLRATNRVLTGPFKTDAEARAYVNQLAKNGVAAFTFTSEAGQKVTRLKHK